MNKPEHTPRIRSAQFKDQKIIQMLLSEFKLPLDGLENTKLWVLEIGIGNVVAVAGLEVYEKQGLLRSVVVNKTFQGNGYGTSLVNYVVEEARRKGMHELFLLTTTTPNFFRKSGFIEFSREKVIGSIVESVEFKSACPKTAILMRLALT